MSSFVLPGSLQAIVSWAGPGNKAKRFVHFFSHLYVLVSLIPRPSLIENFGLIAC